MKLKAFLTVFLVLIFAGTTWGYPPTPAPTASKVKTDVTNFAGNLSGTDLTVQIALDTLDDLSTGGDVQSCGDCLTGACGDGSSDGGTYYRLYDGSAHYTEIQGPSVSGNTIFTLPGYTCTAPATDGSDGQFIKTDGAGTWSFAAAAGGGTMTTLQEGDVGVGGADIIVLDFGVGFALAETPNTEVNVNLDVTPSSGNPTLIVEQDALQVKYDSTLTEGASGLGVADDNIVKAYFGDEDWGDMSVSTNSVTIDEDVLDKANFKDEDWGDVSVSTNSVTLDDDVVAAAEMADADHGHISWTTGAATVEDFALNADADAGDVDIKSVDGLYGVDDQIYLDMGTQGKAILAADGTVEILAADEDITFADGGADLINVGTNSGVATIDFGTINLATDALDLSGGSITNMAAGGLPDNTVQADDIDTLNCGTNCTWDATNDEIDVDDVFITNNAADTMTASAPGLTFDDSDAAAGTGNLLFASTGAYDVVGTIQADIAGSAVTFITIDGTNEKVTLNKFLDTFELGHADDTTIARGAAGAATVEGDYIILSGDTFTGDVTATLDVDGSTALTIADSVAVSSWTLTTPAVTNGITITGADAAPNANGELVYDNVVGGLHDGAFAYYGGGDTVYTLAAYVTVPGDAEDDYVLAYDMATDLLYFKADADSAGAPELQNVAAPTAAWSITLQDTENITWTTETTATDFLNIEATGAFGDISIVKIEQKTGDATDGDLLQLLTADADVDHLLISYAGTDYVTHKVIDAGTYTIDVTSDGTASVAFVDPVSITGAVTNITTLGLSHSAPTITLEDTTDAAGTGNLLFASSQATRDIVATIQVDINNSPVTFLTLDGTNEKITLGKFLDTFQMGHVSDTTISRASAGDINIEDNIVYRAGGTDVPDGDVADDITITNISQVADILATASEINTPLDGASVTLTEFQELETIGATTISANQWAALGGIAETLTSTELDTLDGVAATLTAAELNILDGVSGVTAAELSFIGDVTSAIQAQIDGLGGDVTAVGTCASGLCLDGSVDGGTTISLYDGDSNKLTIDAADLTGDATLVLGSNTNNITVVNGTAAIDIAAAATLNIDKNLTIDGQATTITGADQANTITLNEGFTIGGGHTGTLTFSAASKTLTVEEDSNINQDLSSDSTVAALASLNITTLLNVDEEIDIDFDNEDEEVSIVQAEDGANSINDVVTISQTGTNVTGGTLLQLTLADASVTAMNITSAVNDGNPEVKIGAADAEEAIVQVVYDSGAQTVDYLLIQTQTADATADEGRILFSIDEATILTIDDGGLELGASKIISGTTAITLGAAGATTAITSSDWAIDATGAITNVSLDADGTGNAITNIENADIKAAAAIDAAKIADGTVSSTEFQYLDGLAADLATSLATGSITASTSIDITGATGLILQNDETITNATNGYISLSGHLIIPDAGNIGSATDTDAIAIASDGKTTFSQDMNLSEDLLIGDAKYIGAASDPDAMQIASDGKTTFTQDLTVNEDIIVGDGKYIGSATAPTAMQVASTGIVTFIDDIVIKDAGTIGSASDTDAMAISSAGVVSLSATTEASAIGTAALVTAGGLGVGKDLWMGDDLVLDSDSCVLSFGADNETTITHVNDLGLQLNLAFSIADDKALTFGGTLAARDWTAIYDETTDDRLEWTHTAGAGADVYWDLNDNAADSTYTITNSDATYEANLVVEGNITSQSTSGDSYLQLTNNTTISPSGNRLYVEGNEWKASENGAEEVLLTQEDGATLTGTTWSFLAVTNMVLPSAAADASGEMSMSTGNQLIWHDGTKVITIDTTPTNDNYVLKYDNATATFTLEADATGGTPAWEDVTAPTSDVNLIHPINVETQFTYTGDFTTGAQFNIEQLTGNPTGGILLQVKAADSNVTLARLGDGTNYAQFSQLGAITFAGTGSGITPVPPSADGASLGTDALDFSDIFLATGAVINLSSGDVTITHSANTLAFAGATSSYTFDDAIDITGSEGLIFHQDETITNATDGSLTMSGSLILPNAGVITFTDGAADTITHTNDTGIAMVSGSGTVTIESVVFTGANMSSVGTIGCGAITSTGAFSATTGSFSDDVTIADTKSIKTGASAADYFSIETTDDVGDTPVQVEAMRVTVSGDADAALVELGDTGAVSPKIVTYLQAAPDAMANEGYSGTVITGLNAGEAIDQGNLVYWDATEVEWMEADADEAGHWPARGVALATGSNGNPLDVLVQGIMRHDDWVSVFTVGGPVYLSDDPGDNDGVTVTAPSTSTDCVQLVGWALTVDEVYFNFSGHYLEVE